MLACAGLCCPMLPYAALCWTIGGKGNQNFAACSCCFPSHPLPLLFASMQVLPLGASKGAGVSWLLNRLGVDPAACMALGDGENDLEMLQLVGLGVAMGNAVEAARAVADAATAANSADGVARAVERFVLQPRGLAP